MAVEGELVLQELSLERLNSRNCRLHSWHSLDQPLLVKSNSKQSMDFAVLLFGLQNQMIKYLQSGSCYKT